MQQPAAVQATARAAEVNEAKNGYQIRVRSDLPDRCKNAGKEAASAADDDCRDDDQSVVGNIDLYSPPVETRRRDDQGIANVRSRQPNRRQGGSLLARSGLGSHGRRLRFAGNNQGNMRATARTIAQTLGTLFLGRLRRPLLSAATRHAPFTAVGQTKVAAGILPFLLISAAGAGRRVGIKAAIGAVALDAKVDRNATPRKELRRHQHQDEQRLEHDRRGRIVGTKLSIVSARNSHDDDRFPR